MPYRYSRKELKEFFFEMLDEFNDRLDTDICEKNVYIEFFVPENGREVFERFCGSHFPKHLTEEYRTEGYFESFAAQSFVNEREYGVLIREDIDFSLAEVLQMCLHEISHLFYARNEIEGGAFFDKYCMGSGVEDGMMNAGYAIWREAVADIMADSIASENATISLKDKYVGREIAQKYKCLSAGNPDSKKAMSLIIVYVMISIEVGCTKSWSKAEEAIRHNVRIDDNLLMAILKQIFEQIQRRPYWKITPDFIMTLGETYLSLISNKFLKSVVIDKY